jgi:hypothetical protein
MTGIAIAGLVVKNQAEKQAGRRRNKINDTMEAYQRGKAQKGQEAISQMLDKSGPEQRLAETQKLEGERTAGMEKSVESMSQFAPLATAGKPNEDRTKATGAAASTVAERTRRAIEQLSQMGAPGEQGVSQGKRFGQAAGVVSGANSAIENVGNAYRTDIGNVQADPIATLLGGVMTGVGIGGMAGGNFGGAAAGGANAALNNGQGLEDASGNQYNPALTRSRLQRTALWGP